MQRTKTLTRTKSKKMVTSSDFLQLIDCTLRNHFMVEKYMIKTRKKAQVKVCCTLIFPCLNERELRK